MKLLLLAFFLFLNAVLFAQRSAVAADKMNVFYLDVDNPVTLAAENCPCSQLIVKATNGEIKGAGCKYIFKGKEIGQSVITLYRKTGNNSKKLNEFAFRVKRIPDPVFKIGPYGGYWSAVHASVISAQDFVRADMENFDFDARFVVDSFRLTILSKDSTVFTFMNYTNRISNEIKSAFYKLKISDQLVFDKIYIKGPDGSERQISPVI